MKRLKACVLGGMVLSMSLGLGGQTPKDPGFAFTSGSSFQIAQTSLKPKWTDADNGQDLPDPVGPAHAAYTFRVALPAYAKHDGQAIKGEATLDVIPLKDPSVPEFSKAYKDLFLSAASVRNILKSGIGHPAIHSDLPEWGLDDAVQTIHAKAGVLNGPWCSGIQYLTWEVQDDAPVGNPLTYLFQGLSHDGGYYIALRVDVVHPMLNAEGPDLDPMSPKQQEAYYKDIETRLTAADDESFSPSLPDLMAFVLSIHPSGP